MTGRTGGREIEALTGIRGLAACYVVAYHLHDNDQRLYVPKILLHHGYLSVDVFFVLSGFVMTMSYQRLFASGTTVRAYCAFLMRRVARVYPLYIVMLCLTVVGVLEISSQRHMSLTRQFAATVLLNATMLQGWGLGYSLDPPSWSVSAEVAAYLLFPVLLAMLVRGRTPVWIAALICLGIVAGAAFQPTPPYVNFPRRGPLDVYWWASPWPVIRCVAEFSLGLLAFRVAERRHPILATDLFVWSVSMSLLAMLFIPGSDLLFVCLVPPLLVGLLVETHPVSRVLASPPVLALGCWSYAIYLWHSLLLGVSYRAEAIAFRFVPRVVAAVIGETIFWAVLLFVAALSFRFIEIPGRRYVRRLEARMFPREDQRIALSEHAGTGG